MVVNCFIFTVFFVFILVCSYKAMDAIWGAGESAQRTTIIKVGKNSEAVEVKLRLLFTAFRWNLKKSGDAIVIMDCGWSAETKKILELFASEHTGVLLLTPGEVDAYIKSCHLPTGRLKWYTV